MKRLAATVLVALLLLGCGAKVVTIPDSHALRPAPGKPGDICMEPGYLQELQTLIDRCIDTCK